MQKLIIILTTCFLGGYSNAQTVSDKDGNEYTVITMEKQEWLDANLNTTHFENGDEIKQAMSQEEWDKAYESKTPVWCWPDFAETGDNACGRLYNLWAVVDERYLFPSGWRLPSGDEWQYLSEETLGGWENVETSKSTEGWETPGTNENGLNFRSCPSPMGINGESIFWSSDIFYADDAQTHIMTNSYLIGNDAFGGGTGPASHAMYVRCVRTSR